MQELDLLLRGAALGCACLIGIGVTVGAAPARKAAALVVFYIFIGCYLLVSAPELPEVVNPIRPILLFGAILAPAAFTWAVLEILFDEIQDKWPWLLVSVLIAGSAFFMNSIPVIGPLRGGLSLLLYIGLLMLVIVTGPDDLVEERRRFRRWFVVSMAVLGVIISIVEIGFDDVDLPGGIYLLQAAAFFALIVVFGLWVFTLSPKIWPVPKIQKQKNTAPKDRQLIILLTDAIEERVWQEEGLTIGALAQRLGVAEHRLRLAINQDLGFRNFSAFINSHRITAAINALDDPKRTGSTVLEIAYDMGFASLGPFNKAFRYHTGKSPREYRTRNDL